MGSGSRGRGNSRPRRHSGSRSRGRGSSGPRRHSGSGPRRRNGSRRHWGLPPAGTIPQGMPKKTIKQDTSNNKRQKKQQVKPARITKDEWENQHTPSPAPKFNRTLHSRKRKRGKANKKKTQTSQAHGTAAAQAAPVPSRKFTTMKSRKHAPRQRRKPSFLCAVYSGTD